MSEHRVVQHPFSPEYAPSPTVQIQDPPRLILPISMEVDNGGTAITNIYNPALLPATVFRPLGRFQRPHPPTFQEVPPGFNPIVLPEVVTGGRLFRVEHCSGTVVLWPLFTTSSVGDSIRVQIWRIHRASGYPPWDFDLPEGYESLGLFDNASADPAIVPVSGAYYHDLAPVASTQMTTIRVDPEEMWVQTRALASSSRPGEWDLWIGPPVYVPMRGATYLLVTKMIMAQAAGIAAACI